MSDASRLLVSYIEESTFGTTPSGNLQELRLTSENLRGEHGNVVSNEIRDDRQIPDVKRTSLRAMGDIGLELSYGQHFDDFFQYAALSSAWSSPQSNSGTTISVTAGTSDYDIDDSGSGFGSFVVNQWVYITGFTNAANNGFAKITAAAAGSITVSHNGDGVNESAGASVTVTMLAQVVNGTTLKSMSIEKKWSDLSNTFAALRGMCIDTFPVSIAAEQLITATPTFVGKEETSETATIGTGYDAAPTGEIMAAVDEVYALTEAGASIEATQLNFAIANNLRARMIIGEAGAISIGAGTVGLTGTLITYFESATLYDKFLNQTESSLACVVQDTAGNGYVFDFPRVKYTGGQRVAGSKDSDIMAEMNFTGFRNSDEDVTLRIAKYPVP